MITLSYLTVGIIAYCIVMYIVGWHWWFGASPSLGTFVAWLFSPIFVPLSLLVLLVAYRH